MKTGYKWLNPPPHKGLRDVEGAKGGNNGRERRLTHRKTPPYAFTLAETLIALVIIGIIAAITVPTIVAKQREQATVEKVKKFYSTMSNAVKRAIADTGMQVDEWDASTGTGYNRQTSVKFMNYLKPYLILAVDDCGKDANAGCYDNLATTYLNGNSNHSRYYSDDKFYKAILNDGSVFWLRTNGKNCNSDSTVANACAYLYYDVNGTKAPNVFGKDIFMFEIFKDRVEPDPRVCVSNGAGCAKYIIQNNNMNYLH